MSRHLDWKDCGESRDHGGRDFLSILLSGFKRYKYVSSLDPLSNAYRLQMRLMKVSQNELGTPTIQVCITNLDYSEFLSDLNTAAGSMTEGDDACPYSPIYISGSRYTDCVDIDGFKKTDCVGLEKESEGLYCRFQKTRQIKQWQSDYAWSSSMLTYYWQHGVDEEALIYLRSVGFVHSYE